MVAADTYRAAAMEQLEIWSKRMNDNFITKKSLKPFKKKVGKVDVGCIPFAYINYYPYLLNGISKKVNKSEGKRIENLFMDYGIQQSKILKPHIVIPFGSNLFHIDNRMQYHHRRAMRPRMSMF